MIEAKFVSVIIDYLIAQNVSQKEFLNLFLAAKCLSEMKSHRENLSICINLLNSLILKNNDARSLNWGWSYGKFTNSSLKITVNSNLSKAVAAVVTSWKHYPEILSWLKDVAQTYIQPDSQANEYVTATVIQKLAEGWKDDPDILPILKTCTQFGKSGVVRVTAVHELAKGWKDDPDILPILKTCIQTNDSFVRWIAVYELASGWKDQPGMFELFYNRAINDPFVRERNHPNPRRIALKAIIEQYPDHPLTLPLLRDRAENDPDEQVWKFAKKNLAELEGVDQEPIEEVRSEI